jgi:hypothetical protein
MRSRFTVRAFALILGFCTTSFTPGTARAEEPVPVSIEYTVRHFGAVGDGKTDDTNAIQQAVAAGQGTLRFGRGEYRITRPIEIDLDQFGPISIVGQGVARIIMSGPGPAIRLIGTHDGTASPKTVKDNVWQRQRTPSVTDLEIVGSHPEACGIAAVGTMQLTISRLTVRRALHGIHLVERNRNVIISDCHIYENRGVGVFYDRVNLHQSNIIGCHISYNQQGGVVVKGGDVRNIHIGTCDIEGNVGGPESAPSANVHLDATGGSIGEVAIVGCTIQHAHEAPNSANIRVNCASNPVKFTDEVRHGHITIANNVLSDVQVNVDIVDTRSVAITGNTMWKGYTSNLRVVNSSNIVVVGNVMDRNPRYHYGDGSEAKLGIVFRGCDGCTLSANHIRGTGSIPAAVQVLKCRRFNVTNCTILDYQRCGLLLDDVTQSRVSGCLIRDDRPDRAKTIPLKVVGGSSNQIEEISADSKRDDSSQ